MPDTATRSTAAMIDGVGNDGGSGYGEDPATFKELANFSKRGWGEDMDGHTRKSLIKRTSDILEKLGIAGVLLGIFQSRPDSAGWGAFFLCPSYCFTVWEAKI